MPVIDSSIITSVISAAGALLSGLAGAGINHAYNRRKAGIGETKVSMDANSKLREDLMEERKTLLAELLSERTFFTTRLNDVEAQNGKRISTLEDRIRVLEDANRDKDRTILAQERKIGEQELQINSQRSHIELLQSEMKQLKEHDATAKG